MEKLEWLSKEVSVLVSKEHHFNTDTILLAHFSTPRRGERCADLGTGCGTIPLLWLTRSAPESVLAVELLESACDMARRSVALNGFEDIVSVLRLDIREIGSAPKNESGLRGLDLVACNPPYKADGTGAKSADASRRAARHEDACTLTDIAAAAAAMLRFGGRFCLCQRPERLCDVLGTLRENDLEPKRLRFVHQKPDRPAGLFLVQCIRGGRPGGLTAEPPLFIEKGSGGFSPEMLEIYGTYREGRE